MLQWMYNMTDRTTEALEYSDRCWANTYTPLATTWQVNMCYGQSPSRRFDVVKPMTAEYLNYDWGSDGETTHARHELDIEAYRTYSSVYFDSDHWGESSYVLRGAIDERKRSIGCPYDPAYPDPTAPPPPSPPATGTPLILDLNGDGIHTSGLDSAVAFDIDGDGDRELIGWTDPTTEDAFLWLDLDANHRVDGGRELFGSGTILPGGHAAGNGFEALAIYDQPEHGGDGDGRLAVGDRMFGRLRLWIDRDHDGTADPAGETTTLAQAGIVALELGARASGSRDIHSNVHALVGHYQREVRLSTGRKQTVRRMMNDVAFRVFE
jgi:hypothetical protein